MRYHIRIFGHHMRHLIQLDHDDAKNAILVGSSLDFKTQPSPHFETVLKIKRRFVSHLTLTKDSTGTTVQTQSLNRL